LKVNLTKNVIARVTDEQFSQMKDNARKMGFSVFSEYVRFVCLNATISVSVGKGDRNEKK